MKILVYPHDLGMGGSQLNAIELAAAVRDLGHGVILYGRPGTLNARVDELGLEFVAAPEGGHRPSMKVVKHLQTIMRMRDIDLIHGYEWPPALESALAVMGRRDRTAVATVMSMSVAPFIPRTMMIQVGTEQIAAAERLRGRLRVDVMEPPVDLAHNIPPSPSELSDFRRRWGLIDGEFTVVCVSRLARQLKLEGLLTTIHAVAELADRIPVRLLITGDGPARREIEAAAEGANQHASRDIVTLTGEMLDPRTAYAIADVVIGMGGSALRALAFRKPLIVQGEKGYFRLLSPETVDEFLWHGWYGAANPAVDGQAGLVDQLTSVLSDSNQRDRLGAFGRHLVEERFSLAEAARRQADFYRRSTRGRVGLTELTVDIARATTRVGAYQVRRKALQMVGVHATDDFNAAPVADRQTCGGVIKPKDAVIYIAGNPWDGIAGTDRKLATAVSTQCNVLWVDPPISPISRMRARNMSSRVAPIGLSVAQPGILRLRVLAVPGFSRPIFRLVVRAQVDRAIRKSVRQLGLPVMGVVLASASGRFPRRLGGRRLYYVTDNWPEAADMMGLGRRLIVADQRDNLKSADVVAAVTSTLIADLRRTAPTGLPMHVLPNGCNPTPVSGRLSARDERRYAGLIGQLNERLDFDTLEAVVGAGVEVLVVGPRKERDPYVRRRLDRLLAAPSVRWVGARPADEIPTYLAQIAVGMTPYADSLFNRASCPLKTLEYLAAGLPVVSTDLPAARWLDTALIDIAGTPSEFAQAVQRHMSTVGATDEESCRQFANTHSWRRRADSLISLLRAPA